MREASGRHQLSRAVRVPWLVVLTLCALLAGHASVAHASQTMSDPFAQGVLHDLADGSYLADVTLEGGSGRASVASPTALEVKGSRLALTLVWSSPHYDYMEVAGTRFLPTSTEGNSTFVIPVLALDQPFAVVADTTAMSQPHEIEYRIAVDASSIRPQGTTFPIVAVLVALATGACVVVVIVVARRRGKAPIPPRSDA